MMIWRGTAFICVVTVIAFCAGCSVSKGVNPDVLSASFSLNPASPAVGQSIQFTDTSTGSPTSWQWDFGDGASSTAQNPSHSYTSIGSKTVTLTVANASDSMSANRTLTVVTPVPNSFSFSPVQPKIGQSVQFTDTSTGSPTSWLWDFGDGATSTGRNPSHSYAVAGCYTITLTVSESSGSRSIKLPINIMSASAIIIDHHNTKLANIPPEWITAAKQNLHIAYGTASHGSQLTFGMTGLVGWKGSSYDWNFGGTGGALDLRVWLEDPFGYPDIATTAYYIGSPSITAWADATREYLAVHPEINVVIWSWCAHMATTDVAYVQAYIDLMDELESDFPNVKFVYMTGKTIGGAWGDGERWIHCHYLRATQIREHCLKNNRILYDFADIESWDPDGNWYGDKYVDCDCSYDSNGDGVLDRNWALDWQSDHPGEWYDCYAPHTQPLNANLKAYAAWHLWARLAGWDGN
ncbi:MAG: hypothetical protein A2W03_09860 [Candidatus Aminicenantes bacterium RBG_16_63_16]|nr:MAG: hypothetical protein A2W03_09860 [Candidatus Aminicenantes bacterium RBG_16_63_16]